MHPWGSNARIVLPKNRNGAVRVMQKQALATIDLMTIGRVSSPWAAFSAANGKMVNANVHARNPAISENRVAI